MKQYTVKGMSCAACQARVEKAVRRVPGVAAVSVNLLTNSMGVEGDAAEEAVIRAVEKAGYGAAVSGTGGNPGDRGSTGARGAENAYVDGRKRKDINCSGSASDSVGNDRLSGGFQQETIRHLKNRLFTSVAFLVILMYITMGHNMWGWPMPPFFTHNHLALALTQMLLALIVMGINRDFFISGFRGARHLAPNMDTLVALGSTVSFLWSLYVVYEMCGLITEGATNMSLMTLYHDQLYFESAAMIPTLITVGKLLEAIAKGRTTNALESLMRLAPRTAVLLRPVKPVPEADGVDPETEGMYDPESEVKTDPGTAGEHMPGSTVAHVPEAVEEVRVPIDEVQVGDVFVVRPGMSIPADGFVIEGSGAVNESALTGESVPVEKHPDDRVSAATINMSGELKCKVTRIGEDTTMAQIIRMVSDAAATKAPIARIADRVSAVFVPAVIGIALIVIAGWFIAGESAAFALARGISVLVISCPCALGLATPVAIMVGNGIGAKNGILFKTSEALELCGRVRIVVTDKTGTITYGDAERTSEIREDSREAITSLRKMGLKVIMLSGDKKERATVIADEVGVDEVISEVLPDGKEGHIRSVMKDGITAMVGDGINDAPALTVADIGIAIGDGTDVAIDSADVVLMNSSLMDVVKAIRLSRRTLRNIHQNLFWAFFYNLICIPLAAGLFGLTMNPMIGAAAMSLSSFTVCMNALRLNMIRW